MTTFSHLHVSNNTSFSRGNSAWPLLTGDTLLLWDSVVASIRQWQIEKNLISTQLTVVLPFLQLIPLLRQSWCKQQENGFLPRFETTQTWSARLGGVHQAGLGPTGDAVFNHLQARTWLRQLSHGQAAELSEALVEPLVDIANDLLQAAGALPPHSRADYWERATQMAHEPQPGVAGVEAALTPLAVAWAAATEGWACDILFEIAQTLSTDSVAPSGLVVIQAGGVDALTENLYACWPPTQRLWLDLDTFQVAGTNVTSEGALNAIAREHPPQWQVATGAEDEAELAAAQVISLLNAGVEPVALCSQDRLIVRRVWALLNRQNIPSADETGWILSTTHSAALLMGIVRSAMWDSTPDTILDAFKSLPEDCIFTQGLDELELMLRKTSVSMWPKEPSPYWPQSAQRMLLRVNELITLLRGHTKRSLWEHLQILSSVLKSTQAWQALQRDDAGREVLQVLHFSELDTGPEATGLVPADNDVFEIATSAFAQQAHSTIMSYADFVHWVSYALETVTFVPPAPEQPQVVLTPLARVMLRPFAAVVIPGCDETRLTAPPRLPGFWRESDRLALGLANRQEWWQRLQARWAQALRMPQVTLIWRNAEGSQPLGPASLVQRVILQDLSHKNNEGVLSLDKREVKKLFSQPTPVPAPKPANRLFISALSASAYKTLRDCPYQFYARYLLKLREHDELDTELDQRDYGNWLHAVLRQFHEARVLPHTLSTAVTDVQLLDTCAKEQAESLDPASLIPWQARWAGVRDAYLNWLHAHEQKGAKFVRAEFDMRYELTSDITLQGRMDRMDQKGSIPILIDYKTERLKATQSRVSDPYEDVQLPFYALLAQGQLMGNDELPKPIDHAEQAQAFYLSLDDNENISTSVGHEDLNAAKVALQEGIVRDIQRLTAGFPAYPIGQARSCTYCPAIGLCRKKYWSSYEVIPGPDCADNVAQVPAGDSL